MKTLLAILILLYYIFSAIAERRKKSKEFEWEGDGVLDKIIKRGEQEEQSEKWQPWLSASAPDDDDNIEDEIPTQVSHPVGFEAPVQDVISADVGSSDSLLSAPKDNFETGFKDVAENNLLSVNATGGSQGDAFSSSPIATGMKKEIDMQAADLQKLFSSYSAQELLVVMPAIMNPPEFIYGESKNFFS